MKLYQIKDIEKTSYAFRDYDKNLFNLDDYAMVLETNYSVTDIKEDLDYIFQMGNIPEFVEKYKIRSISVSDVIEIGGKKFYVQNFGFKELN